MTSTVDLIGVIHLPPLPGTPFHDAADTVATIGETVIADVRALVEGGADGALVQTADRVYPTTDEADPARVAVVAILARRLVESVPSSFAIGVQIMRGAVSASLGVAKVAGGSFVRAGALVGRTQSTHGLVAPEPLRIMEYRRRLDAFDVRIIADVDSMHFTWDGDESTGGVAKRAAHVGADAVCIAHPDLDATIGKVADVRRRAPGVPVYLGGFLDHENAANLAPLVDGAFVSGCLLDAATGRVDVERVRRLVEIVRRGEQPARPVG